MSRPKYSSGTMALINACQAVETVKGASVTITLETTSSMALLPPREFQLFDIQHSGPKIFTVKLKP
jgi:hypothetical protein